MSSSVYISLDDFLQLQSLLNYEQEKRNQHIEQCQQQSTPVQQYLLEKQRLEEANLRLQYYKEQYKRRRVQEIQEYLELYRRQALIRAVLQEEEERYYRQCIAAALEQRRVQLLWQRYLQQQQQQQEEEKELQENLQRQLDEDTNDEEEEDVGYSQYRSQQLGDFLKQLFEQQQQQEEEKSEEQQQQPCEDCDGVWKCLLDQKQEAETPRTELPPQFLEGEEEHSASVTPQRSASPPLEDHVITLQDLVQQLASKPVMVNEMNPYFSDEPKPSGIWMKNEVPKQKEEGKAKEEDNKEESTSHEKKQPPFLPQHVLTEAEPTPTRETMPDTPLTQQDSQFVDSVAAEQQQSKVTPEMAKADKQLDDIAFELRDEGDIARRWKQVLDSQLEFKKEEGGGTLVLTASTDANRQFLGSEDELVRVMLKLDAIDSLGDEAIRQKRRGLVKKVESMLDQLDQLKKKHWETQQRKQQRTKKHKKKNRRHHH